MAGWWRRYFAHRRGEDLETLRHRYERFESLLVGNNRVLELIADAGEKCGGDHLFDRRYLESLVQELGRAVAGVVFDLNAMCDGCHGDLVDSFERIRQRVESVLSGAPAHTELVIPLSSVDAELADAVGEKIATLGQLRKKLDIPLPDGFVVTAWACQRWLGEGALGRSVATLVDRLRSENDSDLDEGAVALQVAVGQALLDRSLRRAIRREAGRCSGSFAVRSSALGESGEHTFAGQHETLLNVWPEGACEAYRAVVASLFSPQAVRYRRERGLPIGRARMAVGFLRLVRARASGVIHTVDPVAPRRDVMVVSATWGLGPTVAQGAAPVDRFELSREPAPRVLHRSIARKEARLEATPGKQGGTHLVAVEAAEQEVPSVDDEALAELGRLALRIERHLGQHQEIEWAIGEDRRPVILQARGLRTLDSPAEREAEALRLSQLLSGRPALIRGQGVIACRGVGAGPVVVVRSAEDLAGFPQGAVLVAHAAAPALSPLLPRASAVITNVGSSTGHLAAVAREDRVPMLVGVTDATERLAPGSEVTVDAEENVVYAGVVDELVRFHLREPPQEAEFEEFRLLRRLLRRVAPLHLSDPLAEGFHASACTSYHDVVRYAHEMAVRQLTEMPGLRQSDRRRCVRRLSLKVPMDLDLLDLGGGLDEAATPDPLPPERVRSAPLRALLEGLTAPGTWRTEPVDLDMESLLASATRFSSLDGSATATVRPNLAVITRDYLNLHLRLGYHFNLIDCHLSDETSSNYIYFRFHGGVTDISRRSRRARLLATILKEYDFAVETKGDLVIGRIRDLPRDSAAERLQMAGRLIGYSRQLDVLMRDETTVRECAREFVGRPLGVIDAAPEAARAEPS